MKIAVCIKQVVTREWQLRINEAKTWIRDQDASFELNEPDAYALEEALRLKEKHTGEVVVVSAGRRVRRRSSARRSRVVPIAPFTSSLTRWQLLTRSASPTQLLQRSATRSSTWC